MVARYLKTRDDIVLLLIGTTTGLWEIGALPGRRWWWRRQLQRRALENKAIGALAALADGSVMAATSDGKLWQRTLDQRWHRYTLDQPDVDDAPQDLVTTALAASIDAQLWRGTAPVSLWHTSLTAHADRTWRACATLQTQPEAAQWWGPIDASAPLITAITPDPRDAAVAMVAIAVGGIYHTANGGETWQPRHTGIAPLLHHDKRSYDAHRDVLSLTRHPSFPDTLYATTESAMYRADLTSDEWSWIDITPPHARELMELPGMITPATHDRDTAFAMLPLSDDDGRCTLWQTQDGGASWGEYAAAPKLPLPTMTTGADHLHAATIQVAVSRADPERIALITPDGNVFLTEADDATKWLHAATDLGKVTCACWTEH